MGTQLSRTSFPEPWAPDAPGKDVPVDSQVKQRLLKSTDQPLEPPNPVGGALIFILYGLHVSLFPSRVQCDKQRQR